MKCFQVYAGLIIMHTKVRGSIQPIFRGIKNIKLTIRRQKHSIAFGQGVITEFANGRPGN